MNPNDGESLPPREPAQTQTAGPVWIIDPQTLFRRGLALLLQQGDSCLTTNDAPDIATALTRPGARPALVLVDSLQAAHRHFSGLNQTNRRIALDAGAS